MTVQPTGVYLLFDNYLDATQDAVSRREVVEPAGNYISRRLILDEAEWLARPDLWGVELVSDRKRKLAECYSLRWAADVGLKCPACLPLVQLLATEEGFDTAPLVALAWLNQPADSHSSVSVRAGCVCADHGVVRLCRWWVRGMLSDLEFSNTLIDNLYAAARPFLDPDATAEQVEAARALHRHAKEYGLALALDLCGPNPFRPITFADSWRSESTVSLARTAYDTRNFTLLPILADALEEAGCDNPDVLAHCRDPQQVHVRGCWVVDGVLGHV